MLKPYMAYSRIGGPSEGAMLVFANSAREARVIAWHGFDHYLTGEYIYLDVCVRILRESQWLYKDADQMKLAKEKPHVVPFPLCCTSCEAWGQSEIGEDGLCDFCRDEIAETEAEEKRVAGERR